MSYNPQVPMPAEGSTENTNPPESQPDRTHTYSKNYFFRK